MLLSCDNASLYPVITRLQAVKHPITGWFFCDLKTPSYKMIAVITFFVGFLIRPHCFAVRWVFKASTFWRWSNRFHLCCSIRNKNVPSQNFPEIRIWPLKIIHRPWYQLFILFILKLIIYPPERGEITEIPNVAARPGGLPLLMTSPAVTSLALFAEEDGSQHDCALAGKKISYETSRKEFLPWVTESWFLAVLSRLSALIWFVFAAVGAKSKLHQVPLSWSHSRHLCSWFLQNEASQTETITITKKKNTTGKRRVLLFLIVTVSSSAIWDEDLPNVRWRQKMRRRLRQ